LGASIWTKDIQRAEGLAARIEAGCVFINGTVKSDARLPFGGIKEAATAASWPQWESASS